MANVIKPIIKKMDHKIWVLDLGEKINYDQQKIILFFLAGIICFNFNIIEIHCVIVDYRVFFIWLSSLGDTGFNLYIIPLLVNIFILQTVLLLLLKKIKSKYVFNAISVFIVSAIFFVSFSNILLIGRDLVEPALFYPIKLDGMDKKIIKRTVKIGYEPYQPYYACPD